VAYCVIQINIVCSTFERLVNNLKENKNTSELSVREIEGGRERELKKKVGR
jgi:hypothetical protein